MTKNILIKVIIFFVLFIFEIGKIYANDTGKVIMPFLSMGGGARPYGLGEAFTSLSNDVSAIYWNPAGLGQIKKTEISLSRLNSYLDISYNFIEGAIPIHKGVLGVGTSYIDFGSDEKRDDNGKLIGSIKNSALGLNIGYGTEINDNLMAGISVKLAQQNLAEKSYFTAASDTGMLYRFSKNLAFGYSLQNLGTDIKGYQLPLNLRVGTLASINLISYPANICTDVIFPRTGNPRFATGIETIIEQNYFVRLGFNNKQDINQTFALGFGIIFKGLRADVAYVPSDVLGNTIMFSIGIVDFAKFNKGKQKNSVADTEKTNYIYIKVTDANNETLPKTTIKISQGKQDIAKELTDDNGEYSSADLPIGRYTIKAWKQGYIAEEKEVEVASDNPAEVKFVLKKK